MKQKELKREQKPVRIKLPTKLEALQASVARDYAHQHTVTINSRVRVLEFQLLEADRAVIALTAALARQKEERSRIEASLRGLAEVVGKR